MRATRDAHAVSSVERREINLHNLPRAGLEPRAADLAGERSTSQPIALLVLLLALFIVSNCVCFNKRE